VDRRHTTKRVGSILPNGLCCCAESQRFHHPPPAEKPDILFYELKRSSTRVAKSLIVNISFFTEF